MSITSKVRKSKKYQDSCKRECMISTIAITCTYILCVIWLSINIHISFLILIFLSLYPCSGILLSTSYEAS